MYLLRRSLGKNGCGVKGCVKARCFILATYGRPGASKVVRWSVAMVRSHKLFGSSSRRRALALCGCLALVYLAAGGAFLHQHTGGPDTACHTCQALHIPALVVAPVKLIPEAQQ